MRIRPVYILQFALVLVVLVGVGTRLQRLTDSPTRSPDESVYVGMASRLAQQGAFATRALMQEFVSSPEAWNYPSPLRSGHLLPLAAVMRVTGQHDFSPAVDLSVAASILTLLLAVGLSNRHFGLIAALSTAVCMSASVVELGLARRAWQDSLFCLFNLLLIALALEILRTPGRRLLYFAFHGMGALCLLTKPSAPVLYALCALGLALLFFFRWGDRGRALAMLAGGPAAALAAIGVWSFLSGDLNLTLNALFHSLQPGNAAWEYSRICCSGPVWQLGFAMSLVNPLAVVLAVGGIVLVVRGRSETGCLAAFVLVGFFLFLSAYRDLQSVRYLSPVHGIYCVLAGVAVAALVSQASASLSRESRPVFFALLVAIGIAGMARDMRVFETIAMSGVPDLGAVQVRQILGR